MPYLQETTKLPLFLKLTSILIATPQNCGCIPLVPNMIVLPKSVLICLGSRPHLSNHFHIKQNLNLQMHLLLLISYIALSSLYGLLQSSPIDWAVLPPSNVICISGSELCTCWCMHSAIDLCSSSLSLTPWRYNLP